ncbi:multidrug resistance-associated ABC transporter [Marasmius fiardii PR-910]|nr:multidrug resistance-associated ABC transporter [Marasmius fiardii PR-910]
MAFEAACHDAEGWNTISLLRKFDLTPCFEEGILLSTLYAVVTVAAITRCISSGRQDALERTNKSRWLLRGKMALLVFAFGISVANVLGILLLSLRVPLAQSYILEAVSLLALACLTYINHTHTRRSSSIILIYWPLHTIALGIWTRTVISTRPHHLFLTLPLKWVAEGLGLLSLGLELIGPEFDAKPKDGVYQEHPTLTANIFNIWSFGWMTPLMKRGATQYIVEGDLPNISPQDECAKLEERLRQALKKHSLWRALFVAYGKSYGFAALLKFIQDALSFAQPQLLRLLLVYISTYQGARSSTADERPSPLQGFAIAFVMFAASTAQTVLLNQYFQRAFETGMRIRGGLVSVIYDKALGLSNDEMGRATGDIVNLMSVDATRLQDFCQFGLIAISGPFQIVLAFISLYNLLGWPGFVGVAIMIFSVPLNTTIARILKKMQKEQMGNRDRRTRLMSELLANIKSIKLYAWEFTFMRKILEVRNNQELVMLKKIGLVTSANSMLWTGIPLLVAFSSFAVAAATSEKPLTSDVIFPSITLFLLLQFPLAMFAQVTSNIIEAVVSLQRISQFLNADELQGDARKVEEKPQLKKGDEARGEFSWSRDVANPTLEDINMTVRKGELVGVLGRVGSGKSSLLSAILGDMTRREGEVKVYGNISYASQNPWRNITFFHEYDETFYNLAIEACALGPDLALLPNGDATEVGEKGITLSGGQRARLALARAVYARADLVLLDDCLAAVDSHVARHIFDRVIGPNGILSTKARILVTNSVSFLSQFDQLLFIRRGLILERGTYPSLMENNESEFVKLVRGTGSTSSGSSTPYPKRSSGDATPIDAEFVQEKSVESSLLSEKLRRKGSFAKAVVAPPEPLRQQSPVGLSQEHKEQGTVKWSVYGEYIKAASRIASFFFVFLTIASQAINLMANLVLRSWGEHNREEGSNAGMFRYLLFYGVCSLSSVLCNFGAAVLIWVFCSIRSAQRLHDAMLDALIRAPLGYFEITPTGRIINLFSRDIYVVDQALARVMANVVRTSASTLLILVVIGVNFPAFLISVIPISWFYLIVIRYYLASSRELKRLDSVSRSPIFAWFGESLSGLGTIRAFGMQSLFKTANHRRVDRNQICYLASVSVNRWLSLRLEFVGGFIIFIVVSLSLVQLITTGVDAGLVGFVLSYAINATSSLNWVVRSASEVEQNMVAVERIMHQIEVPSEAPLELTESKPADVWPTRGEIVFNNYSTKYRPELDLVLRNLSFTIKGGERLGICGRTGAGKSSIVQSIFRIIEPVEGTIVIDGVDITKLGLHDLRSSCSTVPQHPELYEGTIRENVDPVGQYSDAEIWAALEQAHLREFVSSVGGLDTAVREGGSSLSAGQRQLICFARAIIKKTKILILDEATSAVDVETDNAIQSIIRSLSDVTVITIAHRLNTVVDYDRILVMDAGKIAELDTPQALLAKKDSIFYSLASEAGLAS